MLLIHQLAYALPITLLTWMVAYLVTIRRKGIQVRTAPVITHFSTLLIINAIMTLLISQAPKNSGADGGWLLISLLLAFLSCAILRHFENKRNLVINNEDVLTRCLLDRNQADGSVLQTNSPVNSVHQPTPPIYPTYSSVINQSGFDESAAYQQIANEIESKSMDKGLWLKAMVQVGGTDANQQVIVYTSLRLKQMQTAFFGTRAQNPIQTEALSATSQIDMDKSKVRVTANTVGGVAAEIKRTSTKEYSLNSNWFLIAVLVAGVGSLFWFKFVNSHKEMQTPGPVAQQNSDQTYVAPNQINTPSSATKLESQQQIGSGMPSSNRYNTLGNYPITDCVKDNSTGLTWEGKPVSGERASIKKYTNRRSGDASAYAKVVNEMHLCGLSDWRLPTNDELVSLVVKGGKPTIDTTWFPNTQPRDYWTSSSWGDDEGRAEAVDFGNGTSSGPYRGDEARVRLVRQ